LINGSFWRFTWFCCRTCYTRSFDGGGPSCKNGDTITIDAVKKKQEILDEEFATRKANWVQPESNIKKEFY
jgi:hypothetical protein